MVRVLFLDIDGVLSIKNKKNYAKHTELKRRMQKNNLAAKIITQSDFNSAYVSWDKRSIKALKKFVKKYNYKIVIISNWRLLRSFLYLKLLFHLVGLYSYVIDVIKRCGTDKKKGICKYIEENMIINPVIVDNELLDISNIYQILPKKTLRYGDFKSFIKLIKQN